MNRVIKVLTEQQHDLWLFDEQLRRWKTEQLTPAQHMEVDRLHSQMERWHTVVRTILALADELKGQTLERLLAKDTAEIGQEYLLGALGKRRKKPTT